MTEKILMTRKQFCDFIGISADTLRLHGQRGWVVYENKSQIDAGATLRVLMPAQRKSTGIEHLDINTERAKNLVADTESKLRDIRLKDLEIGKREGQLFDREMASQWAESYVAAVRNWMEGLPDALERGGLIDQSKVPSVIKLIDFERARLAKLLERVHDE
jgi:hypothetical protein